jgi:hypothetical protein
MLDDGRDDCDRGRDWDLARRFDGWVNASVDVAKTG